MNHIELILKSLGATISYPGKDEIKMTYHRDTGVVAHEVNWHPLAHNPLDYVGADNLQTIEGYAVQIKHSMRGEFSVIINGSTYGPSDNFGACRLLNRNRVGLQNKC